MKESLVDLRIHADIAPLVRLAHVSAAPVRIEPAGPLLEREIERVSGELRDRYEGRAPSEIEALRSARALYRTFGIDPTKTRPSSEALLRRLLKGKAFPAVSNAVDVCNLCAVRSLLPLGLYDADKIEGPVEFRRGMSGESYAGIRKGVVHLDGRPTFADREGPFGNPTSDSLRTCVEPSTTRIWMVFIAPADHPETTLRRALDDAGEDLRTHVGAEGVGVHVAIS